VSGDEQASDSRLLNVLQSMRSNKIHSQEIEDELFDEIVKLSNEDSLYKVYKYLYAAYNNKLSNEYLLSKYVRKNSAHGTNKVKIQLVDVLKDFCHSKLEKRVAAALITILRESNEIRISCVLIAILNGCAQKYSDWEELLKELNSDNFLEVTKKNHEEIRVNEEYSCSLDLSLARCLNLYKQTLNGRVEEILDLKAEMKKRTEGELCNTKFAISPDGLNKSERLFDEKLKYEMEQLLSKISVKKVLSIDDFMKEFYLKIVGGSYFNEESEKNLDKIKTELYNLNPNLKFNKRTSGLTDKYEELKYKMKNILKFLKRLKTKVHQKIQEQTKARSIYQTTMLHYICCAYLFIWIEEEINTLNIFMNTDSYDNLDRITRRLEAMKGRYVNSFDFEDFNAQHSLKHMQIVLKVIIDKVASTIEDQEIKKHYMDIGEWIVGAVENTYTVVEGKIYKWKNGMPTGIRYTSLMNNLMNYLYSKIMYDGLNCIYKDKPYDFKYCEVCGDDSWHSFLSKDHSEIFNYAMLECGYSIQMSKQMTSQHMFEFLRLQYYSNGMVGGCLNRTISNAVCGNWEDDGIEDPFGIFSEVYSTCVSMLRRGMILKYVKNVIRLSIHNTFIYRLYTINEIESYLESYQKSKVLANYFIQLRQIPIELGGLSSLFYGESYKIVGALSSEIIVLNKKIKKEMQREEEDRKTFDATSLGDFRTGIVNWAKGKIPKLDIKDINFKRLEVNTFKLATEGAWKKDVANNPIKMIMQNRKLMDNINLVESKLEKRSFMPKLNLTNGKMGLLLICEPRIYAEYYSKINLVGIVQSMSAANMDIVKFWLINDALSKNRQNELFKKIFGFKASAERLNLVTSVKINSKGKFERLYPTQPTMKLKVMAETESILNACYAVDRKGDLYECILIKEFARRVYELIIRN
jgi:hypothetical protein